MKKTFFSIIAFYISSLICMADPTNPPQNVELHTLDGDPLPLFLTEEPTVTQLDAILSIQLPKTSSYTKINIINVQTGLLIHCTTIIGTNNLIDLTNEPKGIYMLLLNIEGTKYIGQFTL